MSKINKIYLKINKALAENNRNFKMWNSNAIMAEVRVKTYQRMLIETERLHKMKLERIEAQVKRSVKNAKRAHKALEDLVAEKEDLHLQLKEATHFGKKQCEYCLRYFTSQGIKRHSESCASKPEIKVEAEHKEEVKEIKDDIEARKAALKEELKSLEKVSAKKLNNNEKKAEIIAEAIEPEVEVPIPEEEPEYEVEKYSADDTVE